MKTQALVRAAIVATAVMAAPAAVAQDDVALNEGVTLSGGIGVIGIEAKEWVFAGSGSTDHLSLLIWRSAAPVLTTSFDVALPEGWTFAARAQAAMGGDSYMEDFDWIGPDFIDYQDSNWTHLSQHDNTSLDWYFNGSVALGMNFSPSDGAVVNVHGGFKYTDVQWAAVGGTFVYSDMIDDNPGDNFRAYAGTFPDDPAITYRQHLPAAFLGIDTQVTQDAWTFGFGAQAGVLFGARAIDNHWMRTPPPDGLLFIDTFAFAPTMAASASADYAVTDHLHLFLAGTVDKVFLARGNTEVFDNTTGSSLSTSIDTAGAELLAGTVTAGLKGTF
jgi:outer membrane protease